MRLHPLIPGFAASFLLLVAFAAGVGVVRSWPELVTAAATVAVAGFSVGTFGMWWASERRRQTRRSQIYARLLVLRGNLVAYEEQLRTAATQFPEAAHGFLSRHVSNLQQSRDEIREIADADLIENEEALLETTAAEVGLTHTLMLAYEIVSSQPAEGMPGRLRSIADKLERIHERLDVAKDAVPASQHGIIDNQDEFFDRLQDRTFDILG